MSLPEVLLWQRLKGSPQGIAFRKQHPIGAYRADFYCAALKLVIEIDGIAHDMGDRPQRDAARTCVLETQGYQVLRISAADVLKDADAVASAIVTLAARPLHRPSDGPPPRERGGSNPPRHGEVAARSADGGGGPLTDRPLL